MSTEDTTKFDEARAYAAAMRRMHLWVGADIIDSLVEESEKLRQAARLSRSIADEYSAERDALRAENEELRSGWVQAKYTDWKVAARKPGNDTWQSTGTIRNDEPLARKRLRLHRDMGTQPILYKRSVRVIECPWVEVSE